MLGLYPGYAADSPQGLMIVMSKLLLFIHIPDEDTACSYNQVQQKLCRVI